MNHKSFCMKRNIDYKEIIVDNPVFNKFYEINNPNCQDIIAIPDGCVDIEFLWKGDLVEAYVCGSLLTGRKSSIGMYDKCFGIRFNPGTIPSSFKKRMTNIVDNRCELKDFMNLDGMQVTLSERLSLEDKVDYFLKNFKYKEVAEPNSITSFITKKVKEESGFINVSKLVNTTGYSHCYVDRIFKNNVGVSVKKYASIIRLQQAIEIVKNNKEDEVYERLGFYDQAHFIHEFKRFTSITPTVFIKMNEIEIV
ncbi:MAG: AraC family transcriptional regulator [Herbinix sp.]|nr:AraC family transcriptional regulator [Herbinix sp.]